MNQNSYQVESIKPNMEISLLMSGPEEQNLRLIEDHYGVTISFRGDSFYIMADSKDKYQNVESLLVTMHDLAVKGEEVNQGLVVQLLNLCDTNQLNEVYRLNQVVIGRNSEGKNIYPKTLNQLILVKNLAKFDINVAVGPAGTGKTYLAVVHAVSLLRTGKIKKIILTRPVVEAGETLGFLPGEIKEKVDPYLRPLYDALDDMMGKENVEKLIEKGIIEIAPLAYMRGRTLNDAYIILDEAQNTTITQMKMFLTRLGFNSKMVLTGDLTQIDLKSNVKSGLIVVVDILSNIKNISITRLSNTDIIRHPLVESIVNAFKENNL
jgi:phosphate starvation-inducible PhoH-like protein